MRVSRTVKNEPPHGLESFRSFKALRDLVRPQTHNCDRAFIAIADYLVLAIPGTKDNANMIDGTVLAAIKKSAVLVNIGRGTMVDERALLAAVKSGHLYGAGAQRT
jgi:phosphoglycerate dehydrogenase-like enzyme